MHLIKKLNRKQNNLPYIYNYLHSENISSFSTIYMPIHPYIQSLQQERIHQIPTHMGLCYPPSLASLTSPQKGTFSKDLLCSSIKYEGRGKAERSVSRDISGRRHRRRFFLPHPADGLYRKRQAATTLCIIKFYRIEGEWGCRGVSARYREKVLHRKCKNLFCAQKHWQYTWKCYQLFIHTSPLNISIVRIWQA